MPRSHQLSLVQRLVAVAVLWTLAAPGCRRPTAPSDAPTGRIFGLIAGTGTVELVDLDPRTGSVSGHKHLPGVLTAFAAAAAVDTVNGRYFFVGIDTAGVERLYTVSIGSRSIVASPELSAAIRGIEFEQATGQIVTMRYGQAGPEFVRIDPATGTATLIAYVPGAKLVRHFDDVFDAARARYVHLDEDAGWNTALRVLSSGGSAGMHTLPGVSIMGLEMDPATGDLIALLNNPPVVRVARITITGAVTPLVEVPLAKTVAVNLTTFDTRAGRYIFVGQDSNAAVRVFTVDIRTRRIVGQPLTAFVVGPRYFPGF